MPGDHAGGKWRLSYKGVTGMTGTLELDMNFLLRTPLWSVSFADSKRIGSFGVSNVPLLDLHELAAGKLAALFGRMAGRDMFDVRELFRSESLNSEKLRIGFVVYGGINRRDWRTISLDEVQIESDNVYRELLPLLRKSVTPSRKYLVEWTEKLARDCRNALSEVLPLNSSEREFLELLNEHGEIKPGLLTDDMDLQDTIRSHPGLLWKAINVSKHRGIKGENET